MNLSMLKEETKAIFNADMSELEVIEAQLTGLQVLIVEAKKHQLAKSVVSAETQAKKPKAKAKGKPKKAQFTPEQKLKMIDYIKKGMPPLKIADELGVPVSCVYNMKVHLKRKGELE